MGDRSCGLHMRCSLLFICSSTSPCPHISQPRCHTSSSYTLPTLAKFAVDHVVRPIFNDSRAFLHSFLPHVFHKQGRNARVSLATDSNFLPAVLLLLWTHNSNLSLPALPSPSPSSLLALTFDIGLRLRIPAPRSRTSTIASRHSLVTVRALQVSETQTGERLGW